MATSNVHQLRPVMAMPDPCMDFQRKRTAMMQAWQHWLLTRPQAEDVTQEIDGTASAMRGMADLQGIQRTDLFR